MNRKFLLPLALTVALGGCANKSEDPSFGAVSDMEYFVFSQSEWLQSAESFQDIQKAKNCGKEIQGQAANDCLIQSKRREYLALEDVLEDAKAIAENKDFSKQCKAAILKTAAPFVDLSKIVVAQGKALKIKDQKAYDSASKQYNRLYKTLPAYDDISLQNTPASCNMPRAEQAPF